MANEYRRIDAGTDDNGHRWVIAVRGARVLVRVPLGVSLAFGPGHRREQWVRAWIEAERTAETTGIPVVANRPVRKLGHDPEAAA